MKIFFRVLSLAVIAGMAFFYVGCGGSNPEPESAEKKALVKLSQSWKIDTDENGAKLQGLTRTTDFSGFVLTLGGSFNATNPKGPYNYTTSNTAYPNPSPWPPNVNSAWTFKEVTNDTQGYIVTDEGVTMLYELSNSDANLKLTFNIKEGGGFSDSRVGEVKGDWVFKLHK